MKSKKIKIAVVGGGASGALAVLHLALNSKQSEIEITWFEKNAALWGWARGIAYSTKNLDHLLNVRAEGMSFDPDQKSHFSEWLVRNHPEYSAKDFVPRWLYGSYLEEQQEKIKSLPNLTIRKVDANVTQIDWIENKAHLQNETFDHVILATGWSTWKFHSKGENPWSIPTLTPQSKVLILGTGLTMIDCALSLRNENIHFPIFAVSRNGRLPHVHELPKSYQPGEEMKKALEFSRPPLTLIQWIRLFREEVRRAQDQGANWRSVQDLIRPLLNQIWVGFSKKDRMTFTKRLQPLWDIHRHRMPESSEKTLKQMTRDGRLKIVKAAEIQPSDFQFTFDCTGYSKNNIQSNHELFQDLLSKKLIQPDDLCLGFRSNHSHLHLLGPLNRGEQVESTAIPDIRLQAKAIAQKITSLL